MIDIQTILLLINMGIMIAIYTMLKKHTKKKLKTPLKANIMETQNETLLVMDSKNEPNESTLNMDEAEIRQREEEWYNKKIDLYTYNK